MPSDPARLIERIRQVGFIPAAPPGFRPGKLPPEPGLLVLLALAIVLAVSLAVDRSPALQRWVLKPGRSVGEIRPAPRLIQLTSALVLVIFAIVFMVA